MAWRQRMVALAVALLGSGGLLGLPAALVVAGGRAQRRQVAVVALLRVLALAVRKAGRRVLWRQVAGVGTAVGCGGRRAAPAAATAAAQVIPVAALLPAGGAAAAGIAGRRSSCCRSAGCKAGLGGGGGRVLGVQVELVEAGQVGAGAAPAAEERKGDPERGAGGARWRAWGFSCAR